MKSIKKIKKLKGKTVLVRVDFNVPIIDDWIANDFRIKKTISTIKYLQRKKAKIILVSHLGRKGNESLTLIFETLKKHIKRVSFIQDLNQSFELKNKEVVLLENIRREEGEVKNDPKLAKKLADMADIYVNEAFSASHREHASIVGVPKLLPSYIGLQFEKEVKHLSFKTKHPFLFILGGAKFSTKIPLINRFVDDADDIFIGGALMNDFFKAKGLEIGKSLVEDIDLNNLLNNEKIIIPSDVKVSTGELKNIEEVNPEDFIVDVGENSTEVLLNKIKKARLILFNGPLGKYEDGFSQATEETLKAISRCKAKTIIGGGDISSIIYNKGLEKDFDFVSTGGGSTLEFLSKGTLVGIKALE
ncbi:MAG: phosphoglycerate kinase [Patescibacteria group bacterium]|nr:phosphoglycerate kinase [Patescibacteria group bacterium]